MCIRDSREAVREGLAEEFGGSPTDWQHVKGFATLQDLSLIHIYGDCTLQAKIPSDWDMPKEGVQHE